MHYFIVSIRNIFSTSFLQGIDIRLIQCDLYTSQLVPPPQHIT